MSSRMLLAGTDPVHAVCCISLLSQTADGSSNIKDTCKVMILCHAA